MEQCLISEEVAPITRCKYDFGAEGGGGRSGCKTKHCWGLGVAIEKWSRLNSAVQYSLSIQRPGTRADEGGGPSQGVGVFYGGGPLIKK